MHWKQCFKLAAASAVVGGAAFAQSLTKPLPQYNLERFPLNVSGNGDLAMQAGTLNPEGSLRFSMFGEIADDAQLNRSVDGFASYAVTRKLLWLQGTYAANKWVQFSLQVPFVLFQNGASALPGNGFASYESSGIATPYVGGRVGILRQSDTMPLNLALDVRVGLPLGDSRNFGSDLRAPILPTLSASHDFGQWRLSGQVGATFRSQSTAVLLSGNDQDTFDHEMGVGIGVSGAPVKDLPLRLEASGNLGMALKNSAATVQTFAGARYALSQGTEVFLGGGPAFGSLIGTPKFLVMGGVSLTGGLLSGGQSRGAEAPVAEVVASKPACVAGEKHALTDCPDLDEDTDGVANRDDHCPYEAGDKAQMGCPVRVVDTDGDGVVDAQDKCPNEKGELAHQGCVFLDGDKDGIANGEDKCPTEAGDAAHQGCAAPKIVDADADGVPDDEDNCIKEAGSKANHGCPDKKKQLVVITKNDLQILDKVYFRSGGHRIAPRSYRLLTQIASILKTHPNLPALEIQGHTDNRGSPSRNLVLSQKRADAVRYYLMRKGVPPQKIKAKGYGASHPIETNMTAAGREANRRVEFKFLNPTPSSPSPDTNTSTVPAQK
jgi:outer membrane protein OmpA-like peptidoglycan-associated protein